jgi:superoxide dismutase, Cu-Zn family
MRVRHLVLLAAVPVLAAACAMRTPEVARATATLESRSGSNAAGTVTFTQFDDGSVRVRVDASGVTPGQHGFHVHEKGDCSAADASSAGPHFDPTGAPHGPHGPSTHAGDFGNLTAGTNGTIGTEFVTRSITLTPGARSVLGRAVVLHADPDDLTSQPAGESGARIACGVIVAGSLQ